jgi:murein DD-endopeptidase MepM/ murein hydrolase activator NlpD
MTFRYKKVLVLLALFVSFLALFLIFTRLTFHLYADDKTSPQISIAFPRENSITSGIIDVSFEVSDKESKIEVVSIRIDDKLCEVNAGSFKKKKLLEYKLSLDTTKLKEGKHILTISASSSKGKKTSSEDRVFYVDNYPLEAKLIVGKIKAYPGGTIPLQLMLSESADVISAQILDYPINLFKTDDGYKGFVPIRLSVEPGKTEFKSVLKDNLDKEIVLTAQIEITSKKYESEYIVLPETKSKPIPQEVVDREYQILLEKLQSPSDKLYESGAFIVPVNGKITSPFGAYRKFSNNTTDRHMGVDLSCPEGTPIEASGSGVVRLTGNSVVRGNFVMIDHGWGLFSIYNHMFEIDVKEGDFVEKGTVIGKVGSTGLATGPHLHWEVRIGRWVVDPLEWTDEKIFSELGLSNTE